MQKNVPIPLNVVEIPAHMQMGSPPLFKFWQFLAIICTIFPVDSSKFAYGDPHLQMAVVHIQ
jgi:hypothetical protein